MFRAAASSDILKEAIVSIPTEGASLDGNFLLQNRRIPGLQSALVPDVVLKIGQEVAIIDFTVSYESSLDSLAAAGQEKRNKYECLVNLLTARGLTCKVYPFVVGALGAWTKENEEVLSALKIPSGYRRMLRQLIVSDTIRGSLDIWSAFLE